MPQNTQERMVTISFADKIGIFPLSGVVLLPRTKLPLTVFEDRYKLMVDDALKQDRMMGIIQPQDAKGDNPALYKIGCAGRIISFSETDDGRYLITLLGTMRFAVREEMAPEKPYRLIRPDWASYMADIVPSSDKIEGERDRLLDVLQAYFKNQNMAVDWNAIQGAGNEALVASLTMACPFAPSEKQALLEAKDIRARAMLLTTLLEMASISQNIDLRH